MTHHKSNYERHLKTKKHHRCHQDSFLHQRFSNIDNPNRCDRTPSNRNYPERSKRRTEKSSTMIRDVGNENMSYITPKIMLNLARHPRDMIVHAIKLIHFNLKHPENQNMMIQNKKDPYLRVYQNGLWHYKDCRNTLQLLKDKYFNMIDIFVEEEGGHESMSENEKASYKRFQKRYIRKNDRIHKDLRKEIYMLFLTYSDPYNQRVLQNLRV
tara:strand:- start:408 stop:1043 length:636 start_codon:yes stop_codon:yes gene_type:complete